MKKSLILAGMLCIGYANAQYDGKVGINTNEPKATLDVNAETTNLNGTTNEGIIAPKLSKTRIANIEASKLTEGTLVYATDAVYTGTEARVSKIDEKGYYFYNGTEWVKVQYQDTNTNDAEWVYDASTKRINLKRSGQATGFVNKVYYDAQTGQSFNISPNVKGDNIDVSSISAKITNIIDAKDVKINGVAKSLVKNQYFISSDDDSAGKSIYGQDNVLKVVADNSNAYSSLYGNLNNVRSGGSGNVSNLISIAGSSIAEGTGDITGSFMGFLGTAARRNTGKANVVYGIEGQAQIGGSGSINEMGGVNGYVVGFPNTTSSVGKVYGLRSHVRALDNSANAVIDKIMGVYITGFNDTYKGNMDVKNYYGIYIEDAKSANTNYSIYTNAGKVRVGDLADATATTDRVVTVDKDGILKVGSATANNGTQNEANMQCNDANRGKTNFVKDVTIGSGTGDAFAVCLKGTDGKFYWRYLYGAAGVTNKEGNFGAGL